MSGIIRKKPESILQRIQKSSLPILSFSGVISPKIPVFQPRIHSIPAISTEHRGPIMRVPFFIPVKTKHLPGSPGSFRKQQPSKTVIRAYSVTVFQQNNFIDRRYLFQIIHRLHSFRDKSGFGKMLLIKGRIVPGKNEKLPTFFKLINPQLVDAPSIRLFQKFKVGQQRRIPTLYTGQINQFIEHDHFLFSRRFKKSPVILNRSASLNLKMFRARCLQFTLR